MSAPHADRDHSEQPCCGDHNHEPCRGCPDGRDAGTSRSVSAREGCEERLTRFEEVLAEHRITGPSGWGRYGCEATDCDFDTEDWTAWEEHVAPHLMAVADAVVAAGPDADEVTLAEHGRSVREVAREVYGSEIERLKGALANARAKYADEVTRLRAELKRLDPEEGGHE